MAVPALGCGLGSVSRGDAACRAATIGRAPGQRGCPVAMAMAAVCGPLCASLPSSPKPLAMERAQAPAPGPDLAPLAAPVPVPAPLVDERVPRPHRCNDRLEDFVQALFEGDPRKNLPGPAKLFWRCYKSKPGEEPNDPFFFLEEDANGKLVPRGRR